VLAQFLTPDPAGLLHSFSPYAYAAGDPINRWDPSGEESEGFSNGPQTLGTGDRKEMEYAAEEAANYAFEVGAGPPGFIWFLSDFLCVTGVASDPFCAGFQAGSMAHPASLDEIVIPFLSLLSPGAPTERIHARRFGTKQQVKEWRTKGIKYDPAKGKGIPATTTDILPVNPDDIRDVTGARSAQYYIEIDITEKKGFVRKTKSGNVEYVIQSDISPEDIKNSGRVLGSEDPRAGE
jgi:hypothetical protein